MRFDRNFYNYYILLLFCSNPRRLCVIFQKNKIKFALENEGSLR